VPKFPRLSHRQAPHAGNFRVAQLLVFPQHQDFAIIRRWIFRASAGKAVEWLAVTLEDLAKRVARLHAPGFERREDGISQEFDEEGGPYAPIATRNAAASVSVQRATSASCSASIITRATGSVPE
jgi:hypothetical protein